MVRVGPYKIIYQCDSCEAIRWKPLIGKAFFRPWHSQTCLDQKIREAVEGAKAMGAARRESAGKPALDDKSGV